MPRIIIETRYLYLLAHRSYGLFHFIFDLFMVTITAGIWLLWIFIREMRRR